MTESFYERIPNGTRFFGRFRLERCLGASDFAGVFHCSLLGDPAQPVVLKVATHQDPIDPNSGNALRREAQLIRSVKSRHVIRALDYFEDEDYFGFAMRLLPGGSLAEKIHTRTPITEVVRWLKEIALGLNAIHQAGIVHRDIKPENILLNDEGHCVITDFGISLKQSSQRDISADELLGTINFLSPEYIADGIVDTRSDIYAWGALSYLLLTHTLPFSGKTFMETLINRVRYDAEPVFRKASSVPKPLSDLVMMALVRDPQARIQSAKELVKTLEEIEIFLGKNDGFFHDTEEDSRRVA